LRFSIFASKAACGVVLTTVDNKPCPSRDDLAAFPTFLPPPRARPSTLTRHNFLIFFNGMKGGEMFVGNLLNATVREAKFDCVFESKWFVGMDVIVRGGYGNFHCCLSVIQPAQCERTNVHFGIQ
jgi:hypothetical protein